MRNNDIMLFVRCCKCRGVLCCARCWQVSTEEKKKNVSWAWFVIGSRERARPKRFCCCLFRWWATARDHVG